MHNYKTTDYCIKCGQSPESGSHFFNHSYQPPEEIDYSKAPLELVNLVNQVIYNANKLMKEQEKIYLSLKDLARIISKINKR